MILFWLLLVFAPFKLHQTEQLVTAEPLQICRFHPLSICFGPFQSAGSSIYKLFWSILVLYLHKYHINMNVEENVFVLFFFTLVLNKIVEDFANIKKLIQNIVNWTKVRDLKLASV